MIMMSKAEEERLKSLGYQHGDARDLDVEVHRAGAMGDMNVPTFSIHADQAFPDVPALSLEEARAKYAEDARKIGDTLISCLPGGTVHALLVYFLEHNLSLLRIPDLGALYHAPTKVWFE